MLAATQNTFQPKKKGSPKGIGANQGASVVPEGVHSATKATPTKAQSRRSRTETYRRRSRPDTPADTAVKIGSGQGHSRGCRLDLDGTGRYRRRVHGLQQRSQRAGELFCIGRRRQAITMRQAVLIASSHAIVRSLMGVGVAAADIDSVNQPVLLAIGASWFLSPILAGALSFSIHMFVRRRIVGGGTDVMESFLPFLLSLIIGVFALILMKGSVLAAHEPNTSLELFLFLAILLPDAILVSQGRQRAATLEMPNDTDSAERVFRKSQVGTSSYVAFAHGANDVANSTSPVFALSSTHAATGAIIGAREDSGATWRSWPGSLVPGSSPGRWQLCSPSAFSAP
jgi:hypothetical protein